MTINNVYIVDFSALIKLVLPTFLRQVKRLAYLNSLLKPLKEHYNGFVTYKDDAIYRVSHNGSITLLQKVLNDAFDDTERRIYIRNVQRNDSLRIYTEAASKEVGVYTPAKKALRSSFSFDTETVDFIVHIPIEYQDANELLLNKFLLKVRSQVDYYKLFAKKYKIEWIE